MTTPISGVLVTAVPNVFGYPTLSGYTDSNGIVSLPMNLKITYKLTFSGPAIGTIPVFQPANAIITFPRLTANKSFSISNILL
ncbi:MAG: hypothetical protein QW203_07235, partial [Thermoplasmatales archaeon]